MISSEPSCAQSLYMNTYSGSSRSLMCQSVRMAVHEGNRCFLECIHSCVFGESMESILKQRLNERRGGRLLSEVHGSPAIVAVNQATR